MNHKQFENWILDEPKLSQSQEKELKEHLKACSSCRQLDIGWQASKELLKQAAPKVPQPGFKNRWLALTEKKKQMVKVRRYRLTLLALLVAAFAASLTFMVSKGYFLHILADTFNSISTIVIALTNGLSTLSSWLYEVPIAVPLSIGFVLFGLFNAFIMMSVFTLWNLKQREPQTNEIQAD